MAAGGLSAPRLRIGADPNAPLDQRVAALEREHAELFDAVGKLSDETKQKIGELTNAIALERSDRQEGDKEVKQQMKKAVAEGLPLAWVGTSCLFAGIVAASLSPEIASWLGGGACK